MAGATGARSGEATGHRRPATGHPCPATGARPPATGRGASHRVGEWAPTMDLSGLLHGVLEDPTFAEAVRAAAVPGDAGGGSVVAPDAALPFLAAGLAQRRLVLAVTATTRQAEDLAAAASSLLGRADAVAVLPAWETLPHERLSPSSDTVGRRLAVLRRLAHPDPDDPTIGRLDLVVDLSGRCCSRWSPACRG